MPKTAKAHAAHARVAYAIKTGKMTRPTKCEECSGDGQIEAAHHDYSKPLDVLWLCTSCHRKWDHDNPKGGTEDTADHAVNLVELKDRIIEFTRLPARLILGNELNWRTHGAQQSRAVEESLAELGFTDPLKVFVTETGEFKLFDGHLRQKLIESRVGPETLIPVVVTDLSDDEAKKALLLHDPLGAMAGADAGKLQDLMRAVQTDGEGTAKMLAGLAKQNKIDWADVVKNNPGITAGASSTGVVVEDEVPEPPAVPITKPGDLWLLGAYFECDTCGRSYSYEEGKTMEECPCG